MTLHQEATPTPIEINEDYDQFGSAIAVGDFNCDGIDDLAVSMPGEAVHLGSGPEPDVGAVAIFYYDASSPTEMPYVNGPFLLRDDISTIGYLKSGDRFGHALAAMDMNDDGCDELIIGVPGASGEWEGQGAVQVRYGGALGSDGVELAVLNAIDEDQSGDHLGWSLAVGRFNGSGAGDCGDFAVGAPESRDPNGEPGGGRVFVCYGAFPSLGTGQDITETCEYFATDPLGETNGQDLTRFGWSLAAANFDGDLDDPITRLPLDDLAIGAPATATPENGRVYIRPGAVGGLLAEESEKRFVEIPSPDPSDKEAFGYALATGDLQNDGAPDLVVGSPMSEGGRVDVFGHEVLDSTLLPMEAMPTTVRESFTMDGVDMRGAEGCESCPFGEVLAAGDWNGDALDDIAIGIPRPLSEFSGFVAVRFGAPIGYPTPTSAEGYSAVFQAPANDDEPGDQLGFALAAVDLAYQGEGNGSGFDDLAMAVVGEDHSGATHTGIVLVTRPEMGELDGALSGVYQGTVTDTATGITSTVRAYLAHDEAASEVRLRLWVRSGSFHILLDDCGLYTDRGAIDQWAPANTDLARGGLYGVDPAPDYTFADQFTRLGVIPDQDNPGTPGITEHEDITIALYVTFEATPSVLDASGSFQHLEIQITKVRMDITDPDWWWVSETCTTYEIGNATSTLSLDRVNPLWEP